MHDAITRRTFAATGAASMGLTILGHPCQGAATESASCATGDCRAPRASEGQGFPSLEVRPYQLMCVVCRVGAGRTDDLGDARLTALLKAVRDDRKRPLTLRCSTDSLYRYQNPGRAEDTPEGELFNDKRDLDILQKLGLAPGDARPAVDLLRRLLAKVPTCKGICAYDKVTSETWRGCAEAASGHYEKGHALGINALLAPRDAEEMARTKQTSAQAVYDAQTLRFRPHHLLCMMCVYSRGKEPLKADNLIEAIQVVQRKPEIPITLIPGVCMICPPCPSYDAESKLCLGGNSMGLRDQKKDLDVLQRLGLKYGDTLPARKLFGLVRERITSTMEICGFGDGEARSLEWSVCGSVKGAASRFQKAREEMLGIPTG